MNIFFQVQEAGGWCPAALGSCRTLHAGKEGSFPVPHPLFALVETFGKEKKTAQFTNAGKHTSQVNAFSTRTHVWKSCFSLKI